MKHLWPELVRANENRIIDALEVIHREIRNSGSGIISLILEADGGLRTIQSSSKNINDQAVDSGNAVCLAQVMYTPRQLQQ